MSSYSTPSHSPAPTPRRRRLKTCARRCERVCCTIATYFPLAFVYSLTTWAAWVEYTTGLGDTGAKDIGRPMKASSIFGVVLYLLLNASYTTAVFTDPGSPLNTSGKTKSQRDGGKYSILPTSEPNGHALPSDFESITVSSSGSARFCKKCQTPKPDRTHHCSTCKRCVLKMDHHCPWLATCVGLRNYKAFILFLIYTCFFCYVCFASSGYWLYTQMFSDDQYLEAYAPVNIIMLAVISCIIGVVLTGFTGWHIYLILRGQTTIECLEKTRYLSGVRSRVERNRREHAHQEATHHRAPSNDLTGRLRRAGEDILEFHANAIPGASRYEEGEEHTSPAPSLHKHLSRTTSDIETATPPSPTTYTDYPPHPNDTPATRSLRRAYHPTPSQPQTTQHHSATTYEASRETARYNAYLSERDSDDESAKLPNAFDLGWRRNLTHLFGMNPWFWVLPVTNTTGDGWRWEVSADWVRRKGEVERGKGRRGESEERGYEGDGDGYGDGRDGGSLHAQRVQGYDGTYDAGEDARYGRSAVSMQNLHRGGGGVARGRGEGRQWGGRYRKDVDRSGDAGEEEMFEVSSDDDERDEGDEYRDRMWRRSQGDAIDVD